VSLKRRETKKNGRGKEKGDNKEEVPRDPIGREGTTDEQRSIGKEQDVREKAAPLDSSSRALPSGKRKLD